uniref:Magnesium transporter n=1 Tax=Nicotiana sylvestris TaxID=4096 RepID=A0A1U7XQZ2_NICSY|nr:PREDICTED: magnesium transporter MRS2-I-like isoform X3 [Nicotiana sylvestris]
MKTGVSRSWILVDSKGESSILDLDKYAIMKRVPIHARDLRILDPLLSYPSAILGREKAIVLNLEHIKAIITTDEVLLRDPLDDNVAPVVEELQRRLPLPAIAFGEGEDDDQPAVNGARTEMQNVEPTEFPFEFRALEVALEGVCSYLDTQTRELETAAYPALDELTSKISSRNLDRVRKLKSAMTRLTSRVQKVRDDLEQLLEDDDDMADLYLSRKVAGASSPLSGQGALYWSPDSPKLLSKTSKISGLTQEETDVEELEMLLELREYIDDTEDYINIQLDNHRNQLIQLELFLSSGTVCLTVYSLVAAIFGMNIPYPWKKDHGYIFKWVVMLAGIASASIFLSIISYARHKGLVGS